MGNYTLDIKVTEYHNDTVAHEKTYSVKLEALKGPTFEIKSVSPFGEVTVDFSESLIPISDLNAINSTVLDITIEAFDEE